MRLRLFSVVLACLLSSPALANVIYDVTVDYGPPNLAIDAQFSFTMEFATPLTSVPKSQADLVDGDVTNHKLVVDGVGFTLSAGPVGVFVHSFGYLPDGLVFSSAVRFRGPVFALGLLDVVCGPGGNSFFVELSVRCSFTDPANGGLGTFHIDGGHFDIVERSELPVPGAPIPLSPTLLLLVIGLAGLRLSRGRHWSQRNT